MRQAFNKGYDDGYTSWPYSLWYTILGWFGSPAAHYYDAGYNAGSLDRF